MTSRQIDTADLHPPEDSLMRISGLQKMTLLDFPGKVACTVFTPGCNMRCPFCHNSELLDGRAKPLMDDAEFLSFLHY